MHNLNLSQNSNNLNDSSKTQEMLYSNDPSLDDILTYSDDISQNKSCNKSPSKQNTSLKEDKKVEVKPQIPIISSFNSEITMSFLNNDKEKSNNIIRNKEYNYPKSASKPFYPIEELNLNEYNQKNLNKSFNNVFKHYNFLGFNELFEENIGNNLKDVSGFHASISNIFSEFEIKDISISKSNNDIKKNNSEKESNKLNNLEANNKNLISEEHSNTNSMCNYQNNSNVNDVSSNNNKNENKKSSENKKDKSKNDMFSSDEIGEINIKMNISLDNLDKNKNKFNRDKKNFLDELIEEKEIINKKDIFTTSNKKESTSFYAQNPKHNKNSIKYTKAQCVQSLFQNKENLENKQYLLSDAPIKTKDTTSDKKNTKKIISLSPHKLSFEIQKNDCIQISYNKNKNNTINNDLDNNISTINNDNSEISINKVEENNTDKNNNYFYNNECLKQNNTTSFMISPNINIHNKFIHRKISYQKNNNIRSKKIFINNRNVNIQKADSNNFFYNPNNPLASGPLISNISCNKKIINELHTPDLNKNKITPMTCVHKGSLIYYNETNNGEGNNTIKYNYSNNVSHFVKKNKIINNNSIDKKPKINNQKKLVYLKSNANKNNRVNNKENIELNTKLKQNTIINNKNNSYIKINNNENNTINKVQGIRKNSKIIGKQLIKKKKISKITNNNNNSKISNNSSKKHLSIKKEIINNNNSNSITTNNTRRLIRGANKLKIKTKSNSNSIINKINNEVIKESSLFHILYNMPARNANTTKNNSGLSSKDEKESTIVQKNSSKEKEKEKPKKIIQKKLIKHIANNSFSLYNSFFDKMMEDSKRKNNNANKALSKDKNKNKGIIKKNVISNSSGLNGNKSHKKINSEINLDSLTTNFNFNNLNIMKRRKNNKSLYNFGNIFFINQNHIIKDEPEPSNSNVIKYINKNMKIKSKNNVDNDNINRVENNNNKSKGNNKNILIVSTKQNPKIINDFSKYRKKKEIILKDKNEINSNKIYNKQEYKETQLISEN